MIIPQYPGRKEFGYTCVEGDSIIMVDRTTEQYKRQGIYLQQERESIINHIFQIRKKHENPSKLAALRSTCVHHYSFQRRGRMYQKSTLAA